jgi:hypothetical protein
MIDGHVPVPSSGRLNRSILVNDITRARHAFNSFSAIAGRSCGVASYLGWLFEDQSYIGGTVITP